MHHERTRIRSNVRRGKHILFGVILGLGSKRVTDPEAARALVPPARKSCWRRSATRTDAGMREPAMTRR
jgi:hypothetical protein